MAHVRTDTVLEITDGKGKLSLAVPFIVLATMFHPDNPGQRLKFSEVLFAKALLEIEAPMPRKLAIKVCVANY